MRPLMLMLLVAIALPAAGQQLYRWKDENGVVHYTDSPPADKTYETRAIVPDPDPPATVAAPAAAPPPAAPSERCLQARANLQVFDTSEGVSMDTDGDGVEEQLQGQAREREHQRARDLVQAECG
jgi:hypothetical protein